MNYASIYIFLFHIVHRQVNNLYAKFDLILTAPRRFFPNTVILKKYKLIPPEEEIFPIINKCTVLAIPANRSCTLESQPKGKKNRPILLIVLLNNK